MKTETHKSHCLLAGSASPRSRAGKENDSGSGAQGRLVADDMQLVGLEDDTAGDAPSGQNQFNAGKWGVFVPAANYWGQLRACCLLYN